MEEGSSHSALPSSDQENLKRESEFHKRETRITKDNLYMALALWMEMFPEGNPDVADRVKKVGVVFVLPTDRVLAADCSRDGVHGVARVIINHPKKLRDCKVFVSRKPCSRCAKLLVQSRVSRVFYLPIEPESATETKKDSERVDNLFKVSPVGQSVFVPCVEEKVLQHEGKKRPTQITPCDVGDCRDKLYEHWLGKESLQNAQELHSYIFDDRVRIQFESDFMDLMKWLAELKAPLDKGVEFRKVHCNENLNDVTSDPDGEKFQDVKMAQTMMIFAKMLARQTDDPKTGVGAVIVKGTEVVSLGWNGFPSKTLYGDFPRASDDDTEGDKKFPFIIHAEQNALMARNTKDLSGGILFVTKTPCDECTPLLKLSGVFTVVVEGKIGDSKGGELTYNLIKEYIKNKSMSCFEMRTMEKRAPTKRQSTDRQIRSKFSKRD